MVVSFEVASDVLVDELDSWRIDGDGPAGFLLAREGRMRVQKPMTTTAAMLIVATSVSTVSLPLRPR